MPKNIFERFKLKKYSNEFPQRYNEEFYIGDYLIVINLTVNVGGSLYVYVNDKEIAKADVHLYFSKAELARIHVIDEYQLKGIGTLLIELIFQWCKEHKIKEIKVHPFSYSSKVLFEQGLTKALPQEELVAFYKRRGFTKEGNDDFLYANIKKLEKCNSLKIKKK